MGRTLYIVSVVIMCLIVAAHARQCYVCRGCHKVNETHIQVCPNKKPGSSTVLTSPTPTSSTTSLPTTVLNQETVVTITPNTTITTSTDMFSTSSTDPATPESTTTKTTELITTKGTTPNDIMTDSTDGFSTEATDKVSNEVSSTKGFEAATTSPGLEITDPLSDASTEAHGSTNTGITTDNSDTTDATVDSNRIAFNAASTEAYSTISTGIIISMEADTLIPFYSQESITENHLVLNTASTEAITKIDNTATTGISLNINIVDTDLKSSLGTEASITNTETTNPASTEAYSTVGSVGSTAYITAEIVSTSAANNETIQNEKGAAPGTITTDTLTSQIAHETTALGTAETDFYSTASSQASINDVSTEKNENTVHKRSVRSLRYKRENAKELISEAQCIATFYEENGETSVIRDCYYPEESQDTQESNELCRDTLGSNAKITKCHICSKDLCNGAPKTSATVVVVTVGVFLAAQFKRDT